jgi:hypothetical protein
MARVFAVTSSTSRVVLDAHRRGKVTFTVTNTSTQPLNARGRVVPEAPEAAAWLRLAGEPERRLDPGETEQFAVEVEAPATAPAGAYGFRLDAVSVENPDEHLVEGPSVAFDVAAAEPTQGFPWWILIVAGLLLAGLVTWLVWPKGAPGLGETCEQKCAADLACTARDAGKVCVGELGFAGCAAAGDCLAGLECLREDGAAAGTCVGAFGFEGCREANDCGALLACEGGKCLGGLDFAGCSDPFSDCAGGLLCWDGTCKADSTGQECGGGCAPGQACFEVGGRQVCLRTAGQPCAEFWQCASQSCVGGACVALVDGSPCTFSPQCQSNNCVSGTCQTSATACGPNLSCPSRLFRCLSGRCVFRGSVVLESQPLQLELEKVQKTRSRRPHQ